MILKGILNVLKRKMSLLLHELDTVSRVHPDPLIRELLERAHNALYHLSLEMSKVRHDNDDSLELGEDTTNPALRSHSTPGIPFVSGAKPEDRL